MSWLWIPPEQGKSYAPEKVETRLTKGNRDTFTGAYASDYIRQKAKGGGVEYQECYHSLQ